MLPCLVFVDLLEWEGVLMVVQFLIHIIIVLDAFFIQILLWKHVSQVDMVIIFLCLLGHISIDVGLQLEEVNKSDWFCSHPNTELFKDVNLVLTLSAEVVDQAIPILFHRRLFGIKSRFFFKKVNGLDS